VGFTPSMRPSTFARLIILASITTTISIALVIEDRPLEDLSTFGRICQRHH
jgi:hypothetical protein